MFTQFSKVTQEGLRLWAQDRWGDSEVLDFGAPWPMAWGWIWFMLREAEDRPEWFPRGKWSTLQILERWLIEEARKERTHAAA